MAAWAKKAEVTGMLTALAIEFKAQIAASQPNKESTPLGTPVAADVPGLQHFPCELAGWKGGRSGTQDNQERVVEWRGWLARFLYRHARRG